MSYTETYKEIHHKSVRNTQLFILSHPNRPECSAATSWVVFVSNQLEDLTIASCMYAYNKVCYMEG